MTRLSIIAVGAVGVTLLTATPAFADVPYPAARGRCVDITNVLGDDLCARITGVLQQDEARYGDQIAVALVPTTGSTPIEAWATDLFNAWGVGQAGKDNGVLLVVAVNDHRLRIATGRRMFQRLPDAAAGEIINATITPAFKQNRYVAGVLTGLDEIRRHVGHEVIESNSLTTLALGDRVAGPPAMGPTAAGPPAAGPAAASPAGASPAVASPAVDGQAVDGQAVDADLPAEGAHPAWASGSASPSSNSIGWIVGLVGVGALVMFVLAVSTMRGRGARAGGARALGVWSGTGSGGSGSAGHSSHGEFGGGGFGGGW
jgi:uncharacterized protein